MTSRVKPMIALSGVRSSWLMLARKALLRPGRLLRLLLGRAQRDLGAFALDHPPELGTDVGHHVEQPLVRFEGLAREELEHGDDLVPAQHGKAEAGLDPALGRGRRAREVGIRVTS